MNVPLLDPRRQDLPIATELLEAMRRVLASGRYILGPEVEQFEAAAARVAGAKMALGVSSGTDALLLALMALGIGPGDEVICPSFTFFATAGSIARVGARPVFADVCPSCFNIAPEGLEALITPRTKAVIPVHLFGQATDMDAVLRVARGRGLAVIEDAAQAFGASYRGRPVGALGDCGTVSFFPSKNLGALGEAGLFVTNGAALGERARLLRNHGMHPKYFHSMIGGNFRLDALQAALLAVKLPRLAAYTAERQAHAVEYTRGLSGLPGVTTTEAGECCRAAAEAPPTRAIEIRLPGTHRGRTHIVNQYTLRVVRGERWTSEEPPRDALRRALESKGIASEIYYPLPLHLQECFRPMGPHPALPVSERLAREVISIPVFPELTREEQDCVIAAIAGYLEEHNSTCG